MEPIIVELKDIRLIYHEPHAETLAIDTLNMTIREGNLSLSSGHPAAARPLCSICCAGLIPPSSGSVCLKGKEVSAPGQASVYAAAATICWTGVILKATILLALR